MLPANIDLPAIDLVALESRRSMILDGARSIIVDSHAMLEIANDELGHVKKAKNELEGMLKAITDPLRQAESQARSMFRPTIEACAEAEAIVKLEIGKWLSEQRRIAEEARRKADEEQRRQREAAEAEARRKAEEAAQLMAEAATAETFDRQQEVIAQAAQLQAEAVAVAAVPIVVHPDIPVFRPVSGLSTRKKWSAECFDLRKLVAYIADHPEYINVLKIDQSALNKIASAQQDAFRLAGCRVSTEDVIAKRVA